MEPFVHSLKLADGPYIAEPSWEQVKDAVQRLTGDEEDFSVLLRPDAEDETCFDSVIRSWKEPWFAVHGEPEHYIVEFFEVYSSTIINTLFEDSDEEIEMSAFGIFDFFPRKKVVDLEVALRAAKTFYEQGVKDTFLKWSR